MILLYKKIQNIQIIMKAVFVSNIQFTTSNLYRQLIKNTPEQEVRNFFREKFVEYEFSVDHVKTFLRNFKNDKIKYTEENIRKYIDFVSYFQYDICNEFINYIVRNFTAKFFYQICDIYCIKEIIKKNIGIGIEKKNNGI